LEGILLGANKIKITKSKLKEIIREELSEVEYAHPHNDKEFTALLVKCDDMSKALKKYLKTPGMVQDKQWKKTGADVLKAYNKYDMIMKRLYNEKL